MYIAHQTLIVVLARRFKPLGMAPGVEALVLIVLAASGSIALYEAVHRLRWTRPPFGPAPLGRTDASAPTSQAPPLMQ